MSARVEISKRLVLINSASSLIVRLLNISVLVWLQQYLLKRIPTEEYSLLPVIYSVMMFAPLITTFLTGGLGRYIVEAYARGDDDRVTQIVSTMFPILCVAGAVFLAGGWFLSAHIDDILTIAPEYVWDAQVMMALLMFTAAVRLPLSPFGVGLFVRQRFVLQNLINVTTELLRLAVLFTLVFGISTRVLWVVAASATADLVNLFVTTATSRRLVNTLRFRVESIRWPIARELGSYNGWTSLASLADTIRTSADPIILNKLATPLDLTCFHLGSLPMRHIQSTVFTLRAPLQPSLTALHACGDVARLGRLYVRGGRYALWGIQLVVLPLIIYSSDIMTLYVGPQFLQAAVVMSLLLATLPIAYGNMMLPQLAVATGQVKSQSVRAIILHFTNLALTLYFVGSLGLGAVGSALATFLASLLYHPLLMWPLGLKLAGVRFGLFARETLLPGFKPALPAVLTWVALRYFFPPNSWTELALNMVPGMLLYVLLVRFLAIREDDRLYLRVIKNKFASLSRGLTHGA